MAPLLRVCKSGSRRGQKTNISSASVKGEEKRMIIGANICCESRSIEIFLMLAVL
jgi:hypothetical protein